MSGDVAKPRREHTDDETCWCGPRIGVPCPECDAGRAPGADPAGCYACERGLRTIEADDPGAANECKLIVHSCDLCGSRAWCDCPTDAGKTQAEAFRDGLAEAARLNAEIREREWNQAGDWRSEWEPSEAQDGRTGESRGPASAAVPSTPSDGRRRRRARPPRNRRRR